ncbi:MAG: prolyl oligopeptidase family serine peptidase [bacterium]
MNKRYIKVIILIILATFIVGNVEAKEKKVKPEKVIVNTKKPFGFEDAMKFKRCRYQSISDSANWIAYTLLPDRGDGESIIQSLSTDKKINLPRGGKVTITPDELWAATIISPKALDEENASKDKSKLKKSLSIINLKANKIKEYEGVSKFEFTNDSKWVVFKKEVDKEAYKDKAVKKKAQGSELIIKHLESGTDIRIDWVTEYQIDSLSRSVFYIVSSPTGKKDGIYYRDLLQPFAPEYTVITSDSANFANIAWNKAKKILAFTQSKLLKEGKADSTDIKIWLGTNDTCITIVSRKAAPKDWFIPVKNEFKWTRDGDRLFFGFKPLSEKDTTSDKEDEYTDKNFFDLEKIRSKKEMYVWHWEDDRISSNQRTWWKENKNRVFTSVYNLGTNKWVQLADQDVEEVKFQENPNYVVGYSYKPYYKEMTWDGFYFDAYVIDINTGEKTRISEHQSEDIHLSPSGNLACFFYKQDWWIYNISEIKYINLTRGMKAEFWNTENETPAEPGGYGFVGWEIGEKQVLFYDKYDLWRFHTAGGGYLNLTGADGRTFNERYRIVDFKKDRIYFGKKDTLAVEGYSFDHKWQKLYYITTDISGLVDLTADSNKTYHFLGKAECKDKYIYTQESYSEYPDIRTAGIEFKDSTKVTNVFPEIKDYQWGRTKQVRWANSRGDSLDGYIVMPDGFDPAKKYPMLVYIYEKFSEQTYRFYEPRISHRPCYQIYNSSGYLVFVPDITYTVGSPGNDALDCVSSGVRALAKKGFVDTTKLCLQGHSWGAYQTAYIATQTTLFAAASAGAPVGNMTSAYSGIRSESGLARQFQYEKEQSRIGGNLWDSLSSYIRNSPVFQANKAVTPLLILHGDVDQMVPWQQSIELFLAYRRLDKPCIFLQYKDEPHWPNKYSNRVDWAMKMKEFFDHYCLGTPAPKWMISGEPTFEW